MARATGERQIESEAHKRTLPVLWNLLSHRMTDRLIRQALEVNWQNLALGHHTSRVEGATLVRNRTLSDVYDANFVFDVAASEPDQIDRLLALVAREYEETPQLTFRLDPFTPPPFEARLALEGYVRSDSILLVLEGPLRRAANQIQMRPVEGDAGWADYAALKRLCWCEHAPQRDFNSDDTVIADKLTASTQLKCPPVQYILAYLDGRAVGYCSAWEGLQSVGQVEDLFVDPAQRQRGIATAMLHRCVEIARARGAGPIVIVVEATNTAKHIYAALGWRPAALCRQYAKKNPVASPLPSSDERSSF